MTRAIIILFFFLPLGGCSILNMAAGPDNYARYYQADGLKRSIDDAVLEETQKLPPQGWKTKPYSPEQWQLYWSSRISAFRNFQPNESYVGPSGKEWIEYIVRQRRTARLPLLKN